MPWTIVATGTNSWSSVSTGDGSEHHPEGSPIGLLLCLTYPRAGDALWENHPVAPVTTWTEI